MLYSKFKDENMPVVVLSQLIFCSVLSFNVLVLSFLYFRFSADLLEQEHFVKPFLKNSATFGE